MSLKRVAHHVIGGVLIIFVLLGITEFVLRNVIGIVPSSDRMVTYQFDDTLGWTTRNDFKYYRSSLYYGQFNYYNPQGFPTDAADWHTSVSTTAPSIAIVGSSFAESYYLPYEESFPYLIEKGSGRQILNLGVSGYAPDQYLLRARAVLPQYADVKDIVIIFFPFKDLLGIDTDDYQGFQKPYFKESLAKPVNAPLIPPPPAITETGVIAQIRNTAVYTLLRPLMRKAVGINLKESTSMPRVFDAEHMERVFKIFSKLKDEHPNSRLTIYMVPFYLEVANPQMYRKNIDLYETTCVKYSLNCASMDPIIAAHPNVDELFIRGDGHVTAYGAKLVAEQLVSMLSATSTIK